MSARSVVWQLLFISSLSLVIIPACSLNDYYMRTSLVSTQLLTCLFLLNVLWSSFVSYMHVNVFLENQAPCHYIIFLFILDNLLVFNPTLFKINIATTAFFGSCFAWCMFLHPFTFNLFKSLCLKNSFWKHIDVSKNKFLYFFTF